ncbi:membrane protein [Klebsiella variicola]|uniref:Membrane protein n=1 Tax=Klebsiella variicola TaxID=244366 RepID=A0A7H4MPF1_KLEVA|nr:membrane protein [Klebsiella variicola]
MLYLLFFLLKDGPLPGAVDSRISAVIELCEASTCSLNSPPVARATVKGTVAVALGAGGRWAALPSGLPVWTAAFCGVRLMAFLSLIPAVGSAIIWVPAAIYLFATGQLWQGAFIVGFFVIVIGLVDNILRPLLVGKGIPKCRTT